MKKLIVAVALIFAVGMITTSCKSDKKEIKTEVNKQMATEVYQCPMDCEKGKSYSKEGNCPVCKMELKAKKPGETKKEAVKKEATETKKVKEDHSGHDH
jgi:transcription initiation factor IIE alpha subunit